MQFFILITLLFAGVSLAGKRAASTYCYRDNCLRAVAGTQKPGHPIVASNDCKTFLAAATTPAAAIPTYASACSGSVRYSSACSCLGVTAGNLTMPTTSTGTAPYSSSFTLKPVNSTSPLSSVTSASKSTSSSLPFFVNSTLTSTTQHSTSTSLPLTNSTVPTSTGSSTLPPFMNSTVTSTSSSSSSTSFSFANSTLATSTLSSNSSSRLPVTTSASLSSTISASSSTTSSAAPTCTNKLTDPMNCGTCGNVCSSGVCENGVCTSSQCTAQVCGGFRNCNNNSNCFCFSSTHGTNGFCGSNAVCATSTPCANDAQCNVVGSTGNICAVNTCCPQQSNEKPGICLQGQCGNPSAKLMMMVKSRMLDGLTAAF